MSPKFYVSEVIFPFCVPALSLYKKIKKSIMSHGGAVTNLNIEIGPL